MGLGETPSRIQECETNDRTQRFQDVEDQQVLEGRMIKKMGLACHLPLQPSLKRTLLMGALESPA